MKLQLSMECSYCQRTITDNVAVNERTPGKELVGRAVREGWLPVAIGKHVIGYACVACAAEHTGKVEEADDDGETNIVQIALTRS